MGDGPLGVGFPSQPPLQTDERDRKGQDEAAKMEWGRREETAVYT